MNSIKKLLTTTECEAVAGLYADDRHFRGHIVMARHGFGRGEYKRGGGKSEALRWIRAQAGNAVRLIAIDDVDYLRSDAKYTIVA